MKLLSVLSILFCFFIASTAKATTDSVQTEIVINGSTTVLPVMQKAGEAFMATNPNISLAISGGGSGNGIKALNEGLCEVAMSSRDIKPSELEEAKAKGVTPQRTTIAIDALVPVVHPENPVQGLSVEQLRDIYMGKIKNWQEVGGQDEKIVVISRDTSSGTYESWDHIIMNKAKVLPSALLQASNGGVAQVVSSNKKAIGYVGFGYLNKSLKALDVNSIKVSADTALAGKWPIARELYIFTNGEPKGAIKKLTDYLIDPKRGQKAVLEAGYIPLQQ